jgi:predicted alpha/beta superfamily hydrolase
MTARKTTPGAALIILLLPLSTTILRTQSPLAAANGTTPVQIPGTEVQTLTSSIDGQEYKIYVALPPGYSDPSKQFPALYVLDAQWDFPLVEGLVGTQVQDAYVPRLLIVGLTWGGSSPNYDQLRMRDFTPTKGRLPQTGNAPNFLAFIKRDLIPFVDSHYRTTSDRALMGHSAGGLFGMYALLHEPSLFNRYVMASPSLGYDLPSLEQDEKASSSTHPQSKVEVFMSLGGLEGAKVPVFQEFAATLRRDHPDIDLETHVVVDAGHASSQAESYLLGLRTIYAPALVDVAARILDQYVGKYRIAPGYTVEVAKEKGRLVFIAPEGERFALNALSESDFVVRGVYQFLHFKRDDAGHVTGFEGETWNGRHFNERVK